MKPVAYFLCALALALIFFSPLLILSYYEKLPEPLHYSGILHLWHISDWRPGGLPSADFLKKCLTQYESQNPNIFIELSCLTKDQAAKAIMEGHSPDLISYPYGTVLALEFASLPHIDHYLPSFQGLAYPYMCGGYCILVNTDLMDENGIETGSGWGIRPDVLISAAKAGVCFDAEPGYSALPALALHTYPPSERPNINTFDEPNPPDAMTRMQPASREGLDLFCRHEAGVLIASHRQLYEAALSSERGEGPSFVAFAMSGYTDMVQLVSVIANEDTARQTAGQEFAAALLSAGVQKKLETFGVFPSIRGLDIYTDDTCRRAIYQLLCQNTVLASPFERAVLDELALEALGGKNAALQQLRQQLMRFQ